ncbi:MAG: U32 family peptidase C-terminal domain-containing protein [Patescibacteria group bacterium]|jgi:putative protease|nr:U32 family peptidase C-terminal domain-containing protein [Patescibacteria group bacterium]
MKKINKIELLAPAGNITKMKTAFLFGADAVYAGIPDFSLRVRINDFSLDTLREGLEYAHSKGKKMYVTVNIFAHNEHVEKLPKYIRELKKIGVDALIASDPGVIATIKKVWPKAEIHLSTQANCTNWQSAKFWYDQGIKRVILGREVTLKEIKEIKKRVPKIELEYFVHGAMCMAYSGRCFLSKHFVDKSANLGDCVQPCRWNFFISEEKRPGMPLEIVEEEHGTYILNSKDLCLIKHLDKLKEAGVESFKIEGRAKSIYYLATVVGAYNKAINMLNTSTSSTPEDGQAARGKKEINKLYKELFDKLVHRGYTTGFLLGEKADENRDNSHILGSWEFCGEVVASKKHKTKYETVVRVHNSMKIGYSIEMLTPAYEIVKMKITKLFDIKKDEFIESAHGGQGTEVIIETKVKIPQGSVVRRKLN